MLRDALGACSGALTGSLLDRRERRRHVLQGLALSPHAEQHLHDGREDHKPRADEVRDKKVRSIARADELAEYDRPRDASQSGGYGVELDRTVDLRLRLVSIGKTSLTVR